MRKTITICVALSLSTLCLCTLWAIAVPQPAPTDSEKKSFNLPRGSISMWSGPLSTIPLGWAICDGSNGTPDLTDRFILSVESNEDPGGIGGSGNITLSVDNLPEHQHGLSHTHTVNDPGHGHSIIDSGHTHALTDPVHNHTITDTTHSHTVSDPGHYHSVRKLVGPHGSGFETLVQSNNIFYYPWNGPETAATGITKLERSSAGIVVSDSSSGVSIDGNTTGILASGVSYTSFDVASFDGITQETGSGIPFDNRPEYYELAFIMKL